MVKSTLSNLEKKALRAKAHSLKPSVIIGQHGLTEAVLAEIDVALNANELIKVRIRGADKIKRTGLCEQMEKQLNVEVVDQIGFIAVLHRPDITS
ncbi:MAG: YhbY family RNA-binding protein [SAR86 cluster bacterium]|nr:YhbY family RNA-binding protein [SAR86 cluster bacterium]